jgi:hypothetical protein
MLQIKNKRIHMDTAAMLGYNRTKREKEKNKIVLEQNIEDDKGIYALSSQ